MPNFLVDLRAESNGYHEVHTATCKKAPTEGWYRALGFFMECRDAVNHAQRYFTKVNGCEQCSARCRVS